MYCTYIYIARITCDFHYSTFNFPRFPLHQTSIRSVSITYYLFKLFTFETLKIIQRHDCFIPITILLRAYLHRLFTLCFIQADSLDTSLSPLFLYSCTLSRGYTGFFLNLSLAGCTSDKDCPLTEVCIGGTCQDPCLVWNPCTKNAICINTNHQAECSCEDGYYGNGFSYCEPGNSFVTFK